MAGRRTGRIPIVKGGLSRNYCTLETARVQCYSLPMTNGLLFKVVASLSHCKIMSMIQQLLCSSYAPGFLPRLLPFLFYISVFPYLSFFLIYTIPYLPLLHSLISLYLSLLSSSPSSIFSLPFLFVLSPPTHAPRRQVVPEVNTPLPLVPPPSTHFQRARRYRTLHILSRGQEVSK